MRGEERGRRCGRRILPFSLSTTAPAGSDWQTRSLLFHLTTKTTESGSRETRLRWDPPGDRGARVFSISHSPPHRSISQPRHPLPPRLCKQQQRPLRHCLAPARCRGRQQYVSDQPVVRPAWVIAPQTITQRLRHRRPIATINGDTPFRLRQSQLPA